MDKETIRNELMKQARNAFETACSIRDEQRIEVYLYKDGVKVSDVLGENDAIIYGPERILCYQVYGHDYLEAEIKTNVATSPAIHAARESLTNRNKMPVAVKR